MRVGLDFDNTIASYDALFAALAHERGLIEQPLPKRALRDALRRRGEDGERAWTALQAVAYGPRMVDALPSEGCETFLAACRAAGVELVIVSHKTRRAAADPCVDLHAAARAWMAANRIHDTVPVERVFFEETREAKVKRIAALGCAYFVDDLIEVFEHPLFPSAVDAILFDPHGEAAPAARPVACRAWSEIRERVLGH
jgi:hypothetical protein